MTSWMNFFPALSRSVEVSSGFAYWTFVSYVFLTCWYSWSCGTIGGGCWKRFNAFSMYDGTKGAPSCWHIPTWWWVCNIFPLPFLTSMYNIFAPFVGGAGHVLLQCILPLSHQQQEKRWLDATYVSTAQALFWSECNRVPSAFFANSSCAMIPACGSLYTPWQILQ